MDTKTFILLLALIIILVVIILYIFTTYKKFKKLRNEAIYQWSQVKNELKVRFDLIPNVLETLKNHASKENETIKGVIEARNKWTVASNQVQEMEASNQLSNAFERLLILSKNYPTLKTDIMFLNINKSLKDCDSKITLSSSSYNNTVEKLNKKIDRFPSNIIAKVFKFEHAVVFKVEKIKDINA